MAEGAWFFVGFVIWSLGGNKAGVVALGIMALALASHTGLDWWPFPWF